MIAVETCVCGSGNVFCCYIGFSRDLSECIKELAKYNNDATKNDYWSWYEG